MDVIRLFENLLDILPDVKLKDLIHFNEKYPHCQRHLAISELLQEYFTTKRATFMQNGSAKIHQEAKNLHKLFPQFTIGYILKWLGNFIDLPNRKEIVVRHLTYKSTKNTKKNNMKREYFDNIDNETNKNDEKNSINLDSESISNNFQSPNKIRKINDRSVKDTLMNNFDNETFSGNYNFIKKNPSESLPYKTMTSPNSERNFQFFSKENLKNSASGLLEPIFVSDSEVLSSENPTDSSVPYFSRQPSGKNCPATITKPQNAFECDSFNQFSSSTKKTSDEANNFEYVGKHFSFGQKLKVENPFRKHIFSLDVITEKNDDIEIAGKFLFNKSMGNHLKIDLTKENNNGTEIIQDSPIDDNKESSSPQENLDLFTNKVFENTKRITNYASVDLNESQGNNSKIGMNSFNEGWPKSNDDIFNLIDSILNKNDYYNASQSSQVCSLDDFYKNSKPSTSKQFENVFEDTLFKENRPISTQNETVSIPNDLFASTESSTSKQEDQKIGYISEEMRYRENLSISSQNSVSDETNDSCAKNVSEEIRSKEVAEKKIKEEPEQKMDKVVIIKDHEKQTKSRNIDVRFVNRLCEMFPDACRNFIEDLCMGMQFNDTNLDIALNIILETNNKYPKRILPPKSPEVTTNPEEQLNILKEFLPDADPDYLEMMCLRFVNKQEEMKQFLDNAIEFHNYPTLKDYQRRQQVSAQQKQYTSDFSIENFIQLIPNPIETFSNQSRQIKMDLTSTHYASVFLKNTFDKLPIRLIQSIFEKNNYKLYITYVQLKRYMNRSDLQMKTRRKPSELPKNFQNIPLLQEIAYVSHESEIEKYLEEKANKKQKEREEAKRAGLMEVCNCCYDDEIMPRDIFTCIRGCKFCRQCIQKSTEIKFAEGNLNFNCLANCTAEISLQQLQNALLPKFFSKIAQKKALAEVKAAGIEELEMCPFCDFATIPDENDKIFHCLNEECMKESCRLCKEPNHIPLKCEEVEKDEDVKARVFVENQMTEALLRKCYKCGVKFFKEEGCNKMTCSCGASMCYVCGNPVIDYKHFNGLGGDKIELCPLYSDTNVLNKENVLKGAEMAKAAVGINLKIDPSVDLDKHFTDRAKKSNNEPYFDALNRLHNHQQVLARQRQIVTERLKRDLKLRDQQTRIDNLYKK